MNQSSHGSKLSKGRMLLLAALVVIIAAAAAGAYWYQNRHVASKPGEPQRLELVQSVKNVKDSYDLIVVGTDPEGITAAVSGARNGLKTLLVDGRDRTVLGGLMTVGWLNSLDMVTERNALGQDEILNKGLFSEWFGQIEGDSFDVTTAANAFYGMVKKEPNIDLLMKAKAIEPLTQPGANGNADVQGIKLTKADGSSQTVKAKAVIDATQDGDIAAAAGAPFTYGRADMGDANAKMPVTLVFKLKNVTPDVWAQIHKRLTGDNNPDTNATEMSAAGYGDMKDYPSTNKEKVAMRGLNIGRQNDNTILINALQIFHVDGLDPKQLKEAIEIGKKEVPHVVEYMKKKYPEFAGVELAEDGYAPELYVRETRHFQTEYRLNIIDLAENRDQWDRVAFGSYPVDIQRLSYQDYGSVVMDPIRFAVPFRSLVPQKVDGLLVVGRTAGYDSLPHGSARVIPVGMAEGEAAGAAAKLAADNGISFRDMSKSKELIAKLQDTLNKQGMDLKPYTVKPQPYMEHKAYPGLKAVLTLGLVGGGYGNDFKLNDIANPKRMVNLVNGAKKMKPAAFPVDANAAISGMTDSDKRPLTLDQAAYTVATALGMKTKPEEAVQLLLQDGKLKQSSLALIADKAKLTNGDTYLLIKDVREAVTGLSI
ncbi:FAD-dependent oxidoreductase [Paenibacillus chartarius]|uniref:FAD-dependent oxidoreductase n=1 Tax=Paenibacillus chartarius TaxID=747481 RepID=A0ABV6DIS1_9BACL